MMKFSWNKRKARRNEREHGVSFTLAKYALQSGLGLHAEDQYRDEEWRLVIFAPARGTLLLTITITLRKEGEDATSDDDHEEEADGEWYEEWFEEDSIIRVVTARKSTAPEQIRYFEGSPRANEE